MYLVGEQQQVLKGQLYVEKGYHGELITHELEGTDHDMYQPTRASCFCCCARRATGIGPVSAEASCAGSSNS